MSPYRSPYEPDPDPQNGRADNPPDACADVVTRADYRSRSATAGYASEVAALRRELETVRAALREIATFASRSEVNGGSWVLDHARAALAAAGERGA